MGSNVIERKIIPQNPRVVEKQQYNLYAPTARSVNDRGMNAYDPNDFTMNNSRVFMRRSSYQLGIDFDALYEWVHNQLIDDTMSPYDTGAEEHVYSIPKVSELIEAAKLAGIHFVGYISAVDPTTLSDEVQEGEWWYQAGDLNMPTDPSTWLKTNLFTYTNGAWVVWTNGYTPVNFQTWANKNTPAGQPNGWYWFGGLWEALNFNMNLDDFALVKNVGNVNDLAQRIQDELDIRSLDLTIVNAINYLEDVQMTHEDRLDIIEPEIGNLTALNPSVDQTSLVNAINSVWLGLQMKMSALLKKLNGDQAGWTPYIDGTNTSFPIPTGADTAGYFIVFVNGVVRQYNVVSNMVVLEDAPPLNAVIRIVYLDSSILDSIGTPPAGGEFPWYESTSTLNVDDPSTEALDGAATSQKLVNVLVVNAIESIQTDISSMQTDIAQNQSDITTLQQTVANIDISALQQTVANLFNGNNVFNGNNTWNGNETLNGNVVIGQTTTDTLSVNANATFNNDLTVSGQTDLGLLNVNDLSTFNANVTISADNTQAIIGIFGQPTPIRADLILNNPNEEAYMTLDADGGIGWYDWTGASFGMVDDGTGKIVISNTLASNPTPGPGGIPIYHINPGPIEFDVSDLLMNGASLTDPTQGGAFIFVPNPPMDGVTRRLQTDGNGNLSWV